MPKARSSSASPRRSTSCLNSAVNSCIKGVHSRAGFSPPDRALYPLKRGSGQGQRVNWKEAMDDISVRLADIVARRGAEAYRSWSLVHRQGIF